MSSTTFPKYYQVDDVLVIIAKDGDEVFGENVFGYPYSLGKAIVEGVRLSNKEFDEELELLKSGASK